MIPPFGLGDAAISADGTYVAVAGGYDGDLALYRTTDASCSHVGAAPAGS